MTERKRCCCNCGRCIRVKDDNGMVKYNQCELDEHYIGYIETFEGWCPRWKRDRKDDEQYLHIARGNGKSGLGYKSLIDQLENEVE